MASRTRRVVWAPQEGPQHALVDCEAPEIFFGGARGGGKTDGVLGKWALKSERYGKAFNAIMFRRTVTSADDAIERSRQIYEPLGGVLNKTRLVWEMPHGGRVSFRYLDSVADADHFQGRNLTDAWVEEAGQFPLPSPIDRLQGALRSPDGVPVQLIVTANPGGSGQGWLRERYKLHPLPRRPTLIERRLLDGSSFPSAVIPSRISDNKILMTMDPGYVDRLKLVGSEKLVQAWLHGDWSAVDGAFFDEWDTSRHVVEPFSIPDDWTKFRSFDWGSARPFSVGWWAIPFDDFGDIERGTLVRYREWYGASAPNVGLKMTADKVADGIRARECERIDFSVADPSIFAQNGGPSIAERMDLDWYPADNARVGSQGHIGGWDQVRARLRDRALVVFSTCTDTIRTLPVIQHDIRRAEDLDTDAEDHCADEIRYACMSRPWMGDSPNRREVELDPMFTTFIERNLSPKRQPNNSRRAA